MAEFSRHQRLNGQILRVLNELLRSESKDPRLAHVSISSVDVARDLSVARVYFSTLDPDADPEPVAQGLASAAGFLRTRIGRALKIRRSPELRFAHDDSAARGARLSAMLAANGRPAEDEDA
ncbi:MAG: 30S ribosome-binding factor RbfA [Pseudomonadota bacterium]